MSDHDEPNDKPQETSLLDFAMRRERQVAKPTLISEMAEYRAAVLWLPGERTRGQGGSLLIPYRAEHEHDTTEEIIPYTQFMSAHRDGTPGYLCLNFTVGSIEIFGENLRALLLLFHPPGSVKELVVFSPEVHKKPNPDEPVIHSARYVSRAQAVSGG
jgi:hypothetical protein